MGASYLVKQIPSIVTDAYKDVMGVNSTLTAIDTNDIVTMGKALSSFDLLDKWYGALTNRIAKTVVFAREYNADTRNILSDVVTWGAFIQKLYVVAPEEVDNPTYKAENASHSPYDVTTTLTTSVKLFGGEGTWSYEFKMPTIQIEKAFTSATEMNAFVDGQFVAVLNRIESAKSALTDSACNTAICDCIKNNKATDLLKVYNDTFNSGSGATRLTVDKALTDKDFLRWSSMMINRMVKAVQKPNVNYNIEGYATHTPKSALNIDVLSMYGEACKFFAESEVYHNELISLPNYHDVIAWQNASDVNDFDMVSGISVKHKTLNSTSPYNYDASGVIAIIRDDEFIKAHFDKSYEWSMPNPRERTSIHGYQYNKGFGIDEHANAWVFYLADPQS